jgi:hypothetical protein
VKRTVLYSPSVAGKLLRRDVPEFITIRSVGGCLVMSKCWEGWDVSFLPPQNAEGIDARATISKCILIDYNASSNLFAPVFNILEYIL